MESEGCLVCQELLEQASSRILHHIRAVGKLDMALARGDHNSLHELEMAVRDASLCRENAVSQYRHHRAAHRVKESSASAAT